MALTRPRLAYGLVTARGRRADNQDYVAFCAGPAGHPRGACAAVADGLGGHKGGRQAAETAVRAFVDGYYGVAAHRTPLQAASRALEAVNGWIAAIGRRDPALHGMAATFTGMLFVGLRAYVLHVGDSRAYRLTGGRLETLTEDHIVQSGVEWRLARALGFEQQLLIDHLAVDLTCGDRLMLCTDGLHGAVSSSRIARILGGGDDAGLAARRLRDAAFEAGASDNVSVFVADVIDLPAQASPLRE
jgi:serine/threonine protein phosphatase PrpC